MQTLLAQSFLSVPDALVEPGSIELWLNIRSGVTGVVLIALGLVLLMGPTRSIKRGWMVALGVMALGAAVWAAGAVYESDRENVMAGAAAFYSAIEAGDTAAAEAAMAEEVGVAAAGSVLTTDGRAFIVGGIGRLHGAGLGGLTPKDQQGEVTSASTARTQTQLRVLIEGGGPNLVWVALDWRKSNESWQIRGVDILLINGQSPGTAILSAVR